MSNRRRPVPNESLEGQEALPLADTAMRMLAQSQAYANRLAALNEIALAMHRPLDQNDMLQVVGAQANRLLAFDHASVCLWADNAWRVTTLVGPLLQDSQEPVHESDSIYRALMARQPQLILDGSAVGLLSHFESTMIVPLESERQVIGTLHFAAVQSNAYFSEDVRIATLLAQQLATALRNGERYRAVRSAQETLAKYAIQLEERNQELDAYTYTIAHDLKAPLNLVLGYSHLIELTTSLPADGQDYLGQISNGVAMMTRMIDQLLMLARMDDSSHEASEVFVTQTVMDAIERYKKQISDQHISVEVMPDLPDALGHAAWVEEVFANLIGNAVKYIGRDKNPDPRILICGARDGSTVRYEVQDNGIGIHPADQERLFQKFSRVNSIPADGHGLGLSIVQRIVANLNGEVGVQSAPGAGSVFWFTLPAAPHS
jgi:signal transduction histidine kinase